MPDPMPEWFKEYLKGLPEERKEQLWVFLDSDPNALDNMIELVGKEVDFPLDFPEKN